MSDDPVKLILRWDVQSGSETEYSEFIVSDFIPRVNRLGIGDVQFWYTSFGECPQIQVELVAESKAQMHNIIRSEEWNSLHERLADMVDNLSQKMIRATGSIQL